MSSKLYLPASLRSSFDDNCEGALDPSRYLVLVNASAAKARRHFGPNGSPGLDGINAFDLAERGAAYLGQVNLIEVTSFCGPGGLIWGFDLARAPGLCGGRQFELRSHLGEGVPVHDAAPLQAAAQALLGTAERKVFPLLPGSLCPAAHKSIVSDGPGRYYAVLAVGITEPRSSSACIFMEDVGVFPRFAETTEWQGHIRKLTAESVLSVAANQGLRCTRIFVAYADVDVGPDEVGCAMVVAPYFRLARRAWPRGGLKRLRQMSLADWQAAVLGPAGSR